MKKKWAIIGIIAVIVALIIGAIIGTYNNLNTLRGEVEEKSAVIDTQLQRRSDLIPNLVNTVKGYAAHETEVYTAVADARAKLAGATTTAEKVEANGELSGAISRLLAIAESYPELKASENFINLQDELAGTENRITTARNDYNAVAKKYNVKIRSFPTVIVAGLLGFDKVDYFEAASGAENAPTVSF